MTFGVISVITDRHFYSLFRGGNIMEILITVLMFTLGIVLLVKGGDYFVDAASWIAEVSGIPKLIIGATIVSIATTLPEMLVSVMAATQGKVDMSIGNAVGSVTTNIGLIMAIALIFMPGAINRKEYFSKSVLLFKKNMKKSHRFCGVIFCLCINYLVALPLV